MNWKHSHNFVNMVRAAAIECTYCGCVITRAHMKENGVSSADLAALVCYAVRPLAEKPEAAPTKTLERKFVEASLISSLVPLRIGCKCGRCYPCVKRTHESACECGSESAGCGGHSAWCPKA